MSDASGDDGCHELHFPLDRVAMLWMITSSIALGLAGLAIFVHYLRKGQFEDPEDVKYQMFRDEEKRDKEK